MGAQAAQNPQEPHGYRADRRPWIRCPAIDSWFMIHIETCPGERGPSRCRSPAHGGSSTSRRNATPLPVQEEAPAALCGAPASGAAYETIGGGCLRRTLRGGRGRGDVVKGPDIHERGTHSPDIFRVEGAGDLNGHPGAVQSGKSLRVLGYRVRGHQRAFMPLVSWQQVLQMSCLSRPSFVSRPGGELPIPVVIGPGARRYSIRYNGMRSMRGLRRGWHRACSRPRRGQCEIRLPLPSPPLVAHRGDRSGDCPGLAEFICCGGALRPSRLWSGGLRVRRRRKPRVQV